MRIGMVTMGRRGAVGPLSLGLALHLDALSDLFVIVSSYAEYLAKWRATDLEVLETPTYHNWRETLVSLINQPRLGRLANRIRLERPEVLLFPVFHPWSAFLQFYLREIPAVVVVHDPKPHPGDYDWILENYSIRQASRCVVLSAALKPALENRGVPGERIDVIPHGPLYYAEHNRMDRTEDTCREPVILFFGRLTRYKGLDILLEAFNELRADYNARLVIAGAGDLSPYEETLSDMDSVEVVNRWIADEEVPRIFRRASLVVLPYTSATQSGVLTIAAHYSLPVIATRTGGIPEQIENEYTGLLVEPGSSEQLRQAMVRLFEEPTFASRLGSALHQEYLDRYSWEQIAPMYMESCQRAVTQFHRD